MRWRRHFLKNKTKQNHPKIQLDEKILPFYDALDHFVFLYFFNARNMRRLPYIIKYDSSEGL